MLKKKQLLAAVLAACMLLSACGSSSSGSSGDSSDSGSSSTQSADSSTETAASGDVDMSVLNVAGSDPEDVSPFKTDKGTKSLLFCVYEALYDIDPDTGELVPVLADGERGENNGYTVVDDTTYEIYIQDGIYDHAGNPVTASDVAFTYLHNIEEGYKSYYSKLDNAYAIDDTTVCLELTAPIEDVAELNSYLVNIWVYTEAAYNASPSGLNTDACGTGRYKLTDFTSGASLTLERWDDYWQKDESKISNLHQAYVPKIIENFMSEETQIVIALESGTIDLCTKITTENCTDFLEGGKYADQVGVSMLPDNKQLVITPNCDPVSPMNDENLRKAVYYAIDNTYVAASLGEGSAVPSKALGITEGVSDYNSAWEDMDNYQTTYDLDKAKEYLEASSYNGESLKILTNTDNNGVYKTVALCINAFLEELGVKSEIIVVDKATAESMRTDPTQYDLEIGTANSCTSSLMEMYNFLFNTTTTANGETQWFVDDPQLNELFSAAYKVSTHNEDTMNELYEYVMDKGYAYGLLQFNSNVAYRKDKIVDVTYQGQHLPVPGSCIFVQ